MSLTDDIKILKSVELFAGFNDEQLRLLAFGCQRRNYTKGTELFHNGSHGDGGFVVVAGNLHYIPPAIGSTAPQARLFGKGSLVGQLCLVSRVRHNGTAVAETDLEVIRIPREVFLRMLDEYPELAEQLHEKISKSVQEDIRQLERIKRRLA